MLRFIRAGIQLLIASLCLGFVSNVTAQDIEIVAHKGIELDSKNLSLLRAVFTMRTRHWPNGDPIEVVVLPSNSDLHKQFCKQRLRMYPYQLEREWERLIYTGTGSGPTTVDNETELLKIIRERPGAIGYVTQEAIGELAPDDSPSESAPQEES